MPWSRLAGSRQPTRNIQSKIDTLLFKKYNKTNSHFSSCRLCCCCRDTTAWRAHWRIDASAGLPLHDRSHRGRFDAGGRHTLAKFSFRGGGGSWGQLRPWHGRRWCRLPSHDADHCWWVWLRFAWEEYVAANKPPIGWYLPLREPTSLPVQILNIGTPCKI